MKSRYLIVLFILLGYIQGFAQNRVIDSLRGVLKTEQDDTNKINTLNTLGELLWRTGSYDSSMANATKALGLEEKIISSPESTISKAGENERARTYKVMGVIYRHLGNYSKALDFDLNALDINRTIGNKNGMASNLGNIGVVYWDLNN